MHSMAARLQACPHQEKTLGSAEMYPSACKHVLSAAKFLAMLTYWQEEVLYNCQLSASGTAPDFDVEYLWVLSSVEMNKWKKME